MSGSAGRPLVGMIVPPADGAVPPEGPALYPEGPRFIAAGLALPRLTPEGYDSVVPQIARAAKRLAEQGAMAVALMGTSLSFYKGAAFNETLTRAIGEATSLPCTTMSTAVVEALRRLGARRVAVATAYSDEVNHRLVAFLEESGFAVAGLEGLGLEMVGAIHAVTQEELDGLADRAIAASPSAEALLVSCGGLRTLELAPRVEARHGLPVVSSATAGAWAAARLAGHSGRSPGYGLLFEEHA
ncbi:aspartate/glutamate racemase family protein [Muricoccus aerilatus]|uniref:arylmalonate decarboxylase n=1 Tax=Muricoccus aerilatus TaxID=452982 RepID=UPI0005C2136C|nr:aspartate/glutamate racemase family protein [Roseomonas aerilata]